MYCRETQVRHLIFKSSTQSLELITECDNLLIVGLATAYQFHVDLFAKMSMVLHVMCV